MNIFPINLHLKQYLIYLV